jgi:5'-AMP-activated protein kinase catalytic alpha subunit
MSQKLELDDNIYTILKDLGHGSFGTVMLAEDETGDLVAIKMIPEENWNNNNEVISLYLLNDHPGILRLHDYHNIHDIRFIVTEYLPDGDLFDYVNQRKYLDEETARKYFRQILISLRIAHDKSIYHGDLTLENILLDLKRDRVVIADWGLSTFEPTIETDDIFIDIHWTPYRPPEFFIDDIIYSDQLDIWMFGVILYSAVVGHLPFEHDGNVVANVITCRFKIPDYISPELANLFHRIFCPEADRITLTQILYHPWFRCQSASLNALLDPPLKRSSN